MGGDDWGKEPVIMVTKNSNSENMVKSGKN
jgi:hypothetical protein